MEKWQIKKKEALLEKKVDIEALESRLCKDCLVHGGVLSETSPLSQPPSDMALEMEFFMNFPLLTMAEEYICG